MGVPGLSKEIGKGEKITLSKLAVDHLGKTQRPLRIAIDAEIWEFQNQAGKGGKNPALRTLFYRLVRLLALPIHPLFVYDGKSKPLLKRGKSISQYDVAYEASKKLLQLFGFPHHTAPGEAEAECALLQKNGFVDIVMSEDVDTIIFGSSVTLRSWSQEGRRGPQSPTHVAVHRLQDIKAKTGLDLEGMILVALLSGGDYDGQGVQGFGPALSCEVARAGFGADLLEIIEKDDLRRLEEWRNRLQYELTTNESGYFKTKHKSVAIPQSFPDRTILGHYAHPIVSSEGKMAKLENEWIKIWETGVDIAELRRHAGDVFGWRDKRGTYKFVRSMAPAFLAQKLSQGSTNTPIDSPDQITGRRKRRSDGMPELRVTFVPAEVVRLDLPTEEDGSGVWEADEATDEIITSLEGETNDGLNPPTLPRRSKRPPWSPFLQQKIWIAESIVQHGALLMVKEWQSMNRIGGVSPDKKIPLDEGTVGTRPCRKRKSTCSSGAIKWIPPRSLDPIVVTAEEQLSSHPKRKKQSPPTPTIHPEVIVIDDDVSDDQTPQCAVKTKPYMKTSGSLAPGDGQESEVAQKF